MIPSGTITILFYAAYAVVIFASVTGLLKFAFKDNEILQMLHKMAGPVANALFLPFFVLSTLRVDVLKIRLIVTGLFVLLVYTGLVTGAKKDRAWIRVAHQILGLLSFVLFTMLFVLLFLMYYR